MSLDRNSGDCLRLDLVIAMPMFEDWDSAFELCRNIDLAFRNQPSVHVKVVLVDDGSTLSPPHLPFVPGAIESLAILTLRRNLGHQRAIAILLAYVRDHYSGDAVVVMDADGEDRPEDIPKLIAAMQSARIPAAVFARRGRRFESIAFRVFYQLYRILHRVVTGRGIRFGNFSILPWSHLESLVAFPELWNHYAATVLKSRLPYLEIQSDRGMRLAGHSKMNFVSLVVHGLSALFANQEIVGTRLLMLNMLLAFLFTLALATVLAIKALTPLAIPGWATTAFGLLLVLLGESFVASIVLVFATMMNRSQLGFLPLRDYFHFIWHEQTIYSR